MKGTSGDRRKRTLLGLGVVAVSIVIAVVLAGISFAARSSATDQYPPSKLTICHHTHSLKNPVVTITISSSAWKAHKKHGDTQGRCTAAQIKHAKKVAHAKAVKLAKMKHAKKVKRAKHVRVVVHTKVVVTRPHGNQGGNGHGKK